MTTTKTDLTAYGDGELGMNFQNDEALYEVWIMAVRRNDFSMVKDAADEYFEYTDAQLEDLKNDFNDEVNED